MQHDLVCQACGTVHEPGGYPTGCPDCRHDGGAGRLEVSYDPSIVPEEALPSPGAETTPADMWHYRDLLPLLPDDPVTLSEGGTPVVAVTAVSEELGVSVLLKNETVNPTWSYKDRLNSLLLSNAVHLGEERIATSSTGNHGASTAAYASIAGAEETVVLLPPDTEPPIHAQIRAYGGEAAVVEYDARSGLLAELVDRGWYPTVNVTDPYSGLPYSYEAYRTIAFELVDALPAVPDAILAAIGDGDGLYGTWKGFRELAEWGVIDEPPRMIGVQPAERTAVVEALESGADTVGVSEGPMPITTSAGGMSPADHTLRAIRESDGWAYPVERSAIEAAIRTVGRSGVFLEPASAITVAGVEQAVSDGLLDPGETAVCLGTGAGVKWPDHAEGAVGTVTRIEPTIDALGDAVDVRIDG